MYSLDGFVFGRYNAIKHSRHSILLSVMVMFSLFTGALSRNVVSGLIKRLKK